MTETCRVCGAEVKVQIQKNSGYCCAQHQKIGALLDRYHEIQRSEGLTIEDESALGRAQGEAWRAYVDACEKYGITPASSKSPDPVRW